MRTRRLGRLIVGTLLTVKMTDESGHSIGLITVPAAAPGTHTVHAFGFGGGPTTTARLVVT